MPKTRVYELAKELGVDSKAVLSMAKDMGEFVKSLVHPGSAGDPAPPREARPVRRTGADRRPRGAQHARPHAQQHRPRPGRAASRRAGPSRRRTGSSSAPSTRNAPTPSAPPPDAPPSTRRADPSRADRPAAPTAPTPESARRRRPPGEPGHRATRRSGRRQHRAVHAQRPDAVAVAQRALDPGSRPRPAPVPAPRARRPPPRRAGRGRAPLDLGAPSRRCAVGRDPGPSAGSSGRPRVRAPGLPVAPPRVTAVPARRVPATTPSRRRRGWARPVHPRPGAPAAPGRPTPPVPVVPGRRPAVRPVLRVPGPGVPGMPQSQPGDDAAPGLRPARRSRRPRCAWSWRTRRSWPPRWRRRALPVVPVAVLVVPPRVAAAVVAAVARRVPSVAPAVPVRRGRKSKRQRRQEFDQMQAPEIGGVRVRQGDGSTVRLARGASLTDLSEKINVDVSNLVQVLFNLGEMVTATQTVAEDTLAVLATELNYKIEIVSPEDEDRELPRELRHRVRRERGWRGRPRGPPAGRHRHGSRRPRQDEAPRRDPQDQRGRRRGRWHHAGHRCVPGRHRGGRPGAQDHLHRHPGSRGVHRHACPRGEVDRHRRARRGGGRRRDAADHRGAQPRPRCGGADRGRGQQDRPRGCGPDQGPRPAGRVRPGARGVRRRHDVRRRLRDHRRRPRRSCSRRSS